MKLCSCGVARHPHTGFINLSVCQTAIFATAIPRPPSLTWCQLPGIAALRQARELVARQAAEEEELRQDLAQQSQDLAQRLQETTRVLADKVNTIRLD